MEKKDQRSAVPGRYEESAGKLQDKYKNAEDEDACSVSEYKVIVERQGN